MNDEVDAFLSPYTREVQDIAMQLRTIILAVIPSAIEQVDPPAKIIAYGLDRTCAGLICAIMPCKSYVNLMLNHGTELSDPEGLLAGTGKRARHVRVATIAELANPAIRALLEAAAHRTAQS